MPDAFDFIEVVVLVRVSMRTATNAGAGIERIKGLIVRTLAVRIVVVLERVVRVIVVVC